MTRVITLAPGLEMTMPPVLAGLIPIEQLDGGPTIEQPQRRSRSRVTRSGPEATVVDEWSEESWSLELLDVESRSFLHVETYDTQRLDRRSTDILRLHPRLQEAVPDDQGRRIDVRARGETVGSIYDDGRYLIRAVGRADADGIRLALGSVRRIST